MQVLGIETSCDETSTAVYCSQQGLIAHQVYSQVAVHAPHGGVVPELAARDHIQKLLPLLQTTLDEVPTKHGSLSIDGVAYTAGPGLVGALLVGATLGRTLAWAWQVPAVGVHHMEGHLLAPMLEPNPPKPPFVALLVSGGHTMLVEVKAIGEYKILGESVDDAAGEAFDEVAQLLGLGYPGGPEIARIAEYGKQGRFHFPRPMIKQNNLNFSFSGLKTQVLYAFQKLKGSDQDKADIALAFQDAVVDTLIHKCKQALTHTRLNRLVVSGGVSANRQLRTTLETQLPKSEVFYPRLEFCTDNAAMIAYTGWWHLNHGEQAPLSVQVKPRWPLV